MDFLVGLFSIIWGVTKWAFKTALGVIAFILFLPIALVVFIINYGKAKRSGLDPWE